MRRLSTSLIVLALLVPFVLAPAAQAHNDGRGFYGATNDKVVTDAGFILIVFFPLFVFVMSMLQRQPGEAQGSPQGGKQSSGRRPVARRLVDRILLPARAAVRG